MELSRRSFFKRSLLAAGSGSAVAFASGSARAEADCLKKPYKLESVKEVTNICCYCSGGCGTICSSRNGELINLEGDPDHPVNLGGLCPKGAAMWGLRNIVNPDRTVSAHPDRVIYPMVRRPGSTKWERISWDQAAKEALDSISDMNLSELFIVSACLIKEDTEDEADAVAGEGSKNPGLHISVKEAPGVKCPRCWMHSTQAQPETGLCPRCAQVLSRL